MLPFQPVLGAAEVVLRFTQSDGSEAVNTFGVQHASTLAWTAADLSDMCTAFRTWYEAGDGASHTYRSRVSQLCILAEITARDLTVDGSTFASLTVADAGQDTGVELPYGVSFALKSLSGLTGRSNRGRTYLVGLTENSQASANKNQALAAALTDWVDAFNALPATVAAYGGSVAAHQCIISRYHAGVRLVTGTTVPVTSYSYTDTDLDYQRGRAPGH